MTIREYFAVHGSGLSDRDAQIVGPEIERLEHIGLSNREGVRDAARDKASPLHPYVFDRSQKDAAEQHYLERAGHLLRSIEVQITYIRQPNTEPIDRRMRAFYPVVTEDSEESDDVRGGRQYVSITRIVNDVELAAQVWRDGLRRLQLFRAQFRDYDDVFGPVFRAIEETEKRLESDAA